CRSANTSTARRPHGWTPSGERSPAGASAPRGRRNEPDMRHRKDHRKLSRTASHRRALLRNLVTALFQYERIETTVAKAKEARRLGERLITFGKRGDLAARRHVTRFVM